MGNLTTTVRVEEEVKSELLKLKARHRYPNVSVLVADMLLFFDSNDVSPRSAKEPIAKKMAAFRESLFKKMGAFERDYFKAHYNDFNLVSGYLKDELDTIKKMIADYGSRSPQSIQKLKAVAQRQDKKIEVQNEVKNVSVSNGDFDQLKAETEKQKEKRIGGVNYAFDLFEKGAKNKGDKFEIDRIAFTQFKQSITNMISK